MTENNSLKTLKKVSRSVKLVRKSNIYVYRFEEVTVFTILLNFSKILGTRADGIYVINSYLWENAEQMKVVSFVNCIQVMLMIHANRLQKHFLVPSSNYTKDGTIDLLKSYLLYIIFIYILE